MVNFSPAKVRGKVRLEASDASLKLSNFLG
jgi:hypothetical protein